MDGRNWELGLLACLLRNPQYLRHYADFITEKHFSDPLTPKYLRIFKAAYKAHNRLPTMPEMRKLVQDVTVMEEHAARSEVARQMLKDAREIYEIDISDVTRDSIEEFITRAELEDIQTHISRADFGKDRLVFLEEVRTRIDRVSRLSGGYQNEGCFLLRPEMIEETIDALQHIQLYGYRTTGIPRLDDLIGGFGPGEFSCFIGKVGGCKTAMLVNVGAANLEAGERVLHVSLDEPEMQIRKRYLTRLSKIPGKAAATTEQYRARLKHLEAYMDNLIIWNQPNETVTTKDIQTFIEQKQEMLFYIDRRRGIEDSKCGKFGKVIVDYATKTKTWMNKSAKGGMEGWDRIYYTSEEHQQLAKILDIPVTSGLQGNKDMALNEIGQLTSVAMGYAGVRALTNAIVIGQLNEDLHRQPSRLWLYGAKTRTEESLFLVPVLYEKSTQLVWDDVDTAVDYIDSTTSKKAKPKNYTSESNRAARARDEAPSVKENPDYRPADPEEVRQSYQKQRQWRGSGIAATMEDEEA